MERNPKKQVVLSIDFDGTICTVDYPKVGIERNGAKEYINKLFNEGYLIIINTCRTDGKGIFAATDAKKFLDMREIKYHYFNENWPDLIKFYNDVDPRKISADVYIDDKCLFELPEWRIKYSIIKEKYPDPFNKDVYYNIEI